MAEDTSSATTGTSTTLNFRAPPSPSSSSSAASTTFTKPTLSFLRGTWHVTHSTLPMWKSNRNVRITYTPLDSPADAGHIDDLVEYQALNSGKWKTVNGIDKPHHEDPHQATYNWRGKGWLMIASSRWSLVGWGDEDGGWAVTFFAKTLFTPAGIDIYARRTGGLSEELVLRIKAEMRCVGTGDAVFGGLADEIFEIRQDWD